METTTSRQSKTEIYLHFVWVTVHRTPTITPDIERAVYRCIHQEANRIGCDVLALNSMPDRIHLFVKVPSKISASKIMLQIKGVSSHFVHQQLPGNEGLWWQEGYGVFSVGRNQQNAVISYIENQKTHHAENTCHAEWEEADEEYIPKYSSNVNGLL